MRVEAKKHGQIFNYFINQGVQIMTKDMTMGSPLRMILLFSVPVLLGNIFQQFYNMVDTIIVGQYLGEDALAAVGSTGCLMFLVLGFANGIAQGFGVMVSHAFGAKDFKLLKHYVALSLILTAIVSLLLTIPTVAASRQFLILMKTPDNILGLADSYIKVIFAGILLTMSYNVAAGILRGIGDSKTPLYFLILSSFLNIVLDLFLIVVVKLGTAGAAYATIIAQGVSALLCFIYMFRKFDILKTSREDYYLDGYGVFNMLSIGIPMALNYSITAIGTMILQGAVNIFGSSVVAAFTAASKVENLSTQTMPTLGTAIATYCGQNLGAGKYKRIYEGMRKGFFICIFISLAASAICVFGGRFIVSWFVSNPSEEIFDYAAARMDFPLPERPAGLKPRTCSNVKRCCGNGVPYYRDRRHLKSVRLLGSPSGKPDHMAVHRNPSDRNVFYLGKTEPEKTFRFIGLKF